MITNFDEIKCVQIVYEKLKNCHSDRNIIICKMKSATFFFFQEQRRNLVTRLPCLPNIVSSCNVSATVRYDIMQKKMKENPFMLFLHAAQKIRNQKICKQDVRGEKINDLEQGGRRKVDFCT